MRSPRVAIGHLLSFGAIGLLLLSGCHQFQTDVQVNPDGTGTRTILLRSEGDWEERDVSFEEFRQLFHLTDEDGWTLTEVRDTTNNRIKERRLERRVAIDDPSAWNSLAGDIHIRGAAAGQYATVDFRNRVDLEMHESEDGRRIVYRESFHWTGLKEAVAEYIGERFSANLRRELLTLADDEIGHLRGAIAGILLVSLELELRDEEPESMQEAARAALLTVMRETIRQHHPDVSEEALVSVADSTVERSFDEVDVLLEERLPGAVLAWETSMRLRVTMPGEITSSNADELSGQTAIWEFDVLDVLREPRELFVESRVSR